MAGGRGCRFCESEKGRGGGNVVREGEAGGCLVRGRESGLG